MLNQTAVSTFYGNTGKPCQYAYRHIVVVVFPMPDIGFSGGTNHTIADGDVAETGMRGGSELNGVAVRGNHAIGHGDILGHEVGVVALQADAVIVGLNDTVGYDHVLCIHVNTIIVALSQ